jgi:hypothetical protein
MAELSAEVIGKTLSAKARIFTRSAEGAEIRPCITPIANVAGSEFTTTVEP